MTTMALVEIEKKPIRDRATVEATLAGTVETREMEGRSLGMIREKILEAILEANRGVIQEAIREMILEAMPGLTIEEIREEKQGVLREVIQGVTRRMTYPILQRMTLGMTQKAI